MQTKIRVLAGMVGARLTCIAQKNDNWANRHEENINKLVYSLPRGDMTAIGNKLDYEKSDSNKIVIHGSFNEMDESGRFGGWFDFRVVVTPSLQLGYEVRVVGPFSKVKDGENLRDTLRDTYDYDLEKEYKR